MLLLHFSILTKINELRSSSPSCFFFFRLFTLNNLLFWELLLVSLFFESSLILFFNIGILLKFLFSLFLCNSFFLLIVSKPSLDSTMGVFFKLLLFSILTCSSDVDFCLKVLKSTVGLMFEFFWIAFTLILSCMLAVTGLLTRWEESGNSNSSSGSFFLRIMKLFARWNITFALVDRVEIKNRCAARILSRRRLSFVSRNIADILSFGEYLAFEISALFSKPYRS